MWSINALLKTGQKETLLQARDRKIKRGGQIEREREGHNGREIEREFETDHSLLYTLGPRQHTHSSHLLLNKPACVSSQRCFYITFTVFDTVLYFIFHFNDSETTVKIIAISGFESMSSRLEVKRPSH